ncbi:MAG: tryptophan synthase subunit alpha [Gammaproteobacteria bacterium]|nr:tryptophan synthase subunit alpha [Gammaproteobacteria bacterium]
MSRIENKFNSVKDKASTALIPYITAGDPKPQYTVKMMHTLVEAGADFLELGVPFSDPMADGPVIQRASERALKHKVSLNDVFDMVKLFRQKDNETPVILMGYLNPIEVMGYTLFAKSAAAAGVDGIITVDMPPEEGADYLSALYQHEIAPIFLTAPTSTDQRIQTISGAGRGFIYYVSFKGITGASHLDVSSVEMNLKRIRAQTDLPVVVGFGIKDAASAAEVAKIADAVVVGSAVINKVEENMDSEEMIMSSISGLITQMKKAIDDVVC